MIIALISNIVRILLLFGVANFFELYFIFYIACCVMLFGVYKMAQRIRSGKVTRAEAHKMNFNSSNITIIVGGVICTLVIAEFHIQSAVVCFMFHLCMSMLLVDIKNNVDKFLLKNGLKK